MWQVVKLGSLGIRIVCALRLYVARFCLQIVVEGAVSWRVSQDLKEGLGLIWTEGYVLCLDVFQKLTRVYLLGYSCLSLLHSVFGATYLSLAVSAVCSRRTTRLLICFSLSSK